MLKARSASVVGYRLGLGLVAVVGGMLLAFALLRGPVLAEVLDSSAGEGAGVAAQVPLPSHTPVPPCGLLDGTIIDPMKTINGWYTRTSDITSTIALTVVPGCNGLALQLSYTFTNVLTRPWVQIRRDFSPPLDLSGGDHLRFLYYGTATNTLEVGLVSPADENYFTYSFGEATHVMTCTYATWDFQGFRKDGQPFPNFSQVRSIFISVVKTQGAVGGSGRLVVDDLQYVQAASRTVPTAFATVTPNATAVAAAATYIAARQHLGGPQPGLLESWEEEPDDYSWLYDQALGLLVLARTNMTAANQLVTRLHALQNADGSWYNGYHYLTGVEITTEKAVGAIAWLAYALQRYYEEGGAYSQIAYEDAREAACWLAAQQQQRPDGSVDVGTEPNLDAWWAFRALGFQGQMDRLEAYLLTQAWDANMGRFKSSATNYEIFLDNQTWGAAFLRAIGRDADARRALSYARWMLATTSWDRSTCGYDGAGPFSVWNEGTLQYVVAGGENSQYYWDQQVSRQDASGGVRGSPDDFRGYIVWLTRWHGVAPTAWLYFAGTGGPFQPPEACTITFSDVPPSNTFYPFIRCLACRQIISGYADGTFRWQNDVIRGQLAKIIATAGCCFDPIPTTQQTFTDVPPNNPFWIFIERLAGRHIINGYPCGGPGEPCDPQNRFYFRPYANATRGQISKITSLAAGWNGPIPTTQQTFADVPPTNNFWVWIEELASRQIISGYACGGPGEPCDAQNRPYFRWGNNTTRGQLTKIAANAFFPNCQTPAR